MKGLKVGILTASDSGAKGEREDASGAKIREIVEAHGGTVIHHVIVADDRDVIARELRDMADHRGADVIFTTGGTGLGPRDNTPEATYEVIEKEVPGIAEAMRWHSLKFTPRAMLSRAIAGVRGTTLIVNMPGSTKAVEECLQVVLPAIPHAVAVLRGEVRNCAAEREVAGDADPH
ncbi:MAG: MogA/MoaB family molybdenum cofactor biosynthesis protein [Bacillota bacterium]